MTKGNGIIMQKDRSPEAPWLSGNRALSSSGEGKLQRAILVSGGKMLQTPLSGKPQADGISGQASPPLGTQSSGSDAGDGYRSGWQWHLPPVS